MPLDLRLVGLGAIWLGCGLVGACTFHLHDVEPPGSGDASAGASAADAAAGSGGGTGGGATGGSAGSLPAGGSGGGGAGGATGTGGSGGSSACDPSDYCEVNNHPSGWFCDGSIRIHCGTQGTCKVVIASQDCGGVGCVGGACNDACGTTCIDRCGSYQSCDCGTCGTNMVCTNNTCVPDCPSLCSGHCGSYAGCSCGACSGTQGCTNNVCTECASGDTDTQSCAIGNVCTGELKRTCSASGSWGAWGTCGASPSSPTYFVDGMKRCSGATPSMCITITPPQSNTTVNVILSKEDGTTFTYDADVVVSADSTSKTYSCQSMAGKTSYTLIVDPGELGIAVVGKEYSVSADVLSPCGSSTHHITGYDMIARCK
jgi:hypothetical protein